MSESNLNQRFYEALGGMELSVDGIREYEFVTEQVLSLQKELDAQLASFGDISKYTQPAQEALLDSLSLHVQNQFMALEGLSYDDEVIVSGSPTFIFVANSDYSEFLPTPKPSRMHGFVQMPLLKFLSNSGAESGRVGVFLPIKQPIVEVEAEGGVRAVHLPEQVRVFLSLASGQPSIKRRLEGVE